MVHGSRFPAESEISPHRIASGIFERRGRIFHFLCLFIKETQNMM
jgi:hypothetical protein